MSCGTDSPLPGATVELFASDGSTQINVGPDGILGTTDDAPGGITSTSGDSCSSPNGNYLFSGLPAGQYIVKVLPTGYPSTIDTYNSADTLSPDENVDNNDNGLGTGVGTVSSNKVTLTPGYVGQLSNNIVTNATGTTYNPTLDFGFVTSLGKKIVSTSSTYTTGSNVAIGEIITYEVDMSIPANATFAGVTLVDIPDSGLAFVHCISVTPPAGVTMNGFTTCNEGTTAGSNPLISNSGGTVAFDFGTIKSISSSTEVIKVQYSMVVLDILANQNGDSLTNHAVWAWNGGTATTSAPPVKIVEPKLTISKSANPTIAKPGETITFTIDIAHSAQSEEDALYEVVTDQIPTSLSFVTGSLTVTGTAAPSLTSTNYDSATHTLTVNWNDFPLGKTAQISYQAIFVGPPPVVNAVSAEWTSLFIDPVPTPPQQSPYNTSSTQRWYAPSTSAGVDDYGSSSSAMISSPSSHKAGSINESAFAGVEPVTPLTGFAPGQVTLLPVQPEDKAYQDLGNFWVEIPRLKVSIPIVGIPVNTDGSWDLTWLGDQAGYLDGTAYPTHDGNSVITAHVYMSNGLPGPFVNLHTLQWGDQIIIHIAGQRYIYEVQENNIVSPTDISAFKHEEQPWLTLITCKDYNASTNTYAHRVVVGAVLIKVQPDTSSNGE